MQTKTKINAIYRKIPVTKQSHSLRRSKKHLATGRCPFFAYYPPWHLLEYYQCISKSCIVSSPLWASSAAFPSINLTTKHGVMPIYFSQIDMKVAVAENTHFTPWKSSWRRSTKMACICVENSAGAVFNYQSNFYSQICCNGWRAPNWNVRFLCNQVLCKCLQVWFWA